MDLIEHLIRQKTWSERTFGPGQRTEMVIAHIRKELDEIQGSPDDIFEWVDVVLLALDGAWRAGFSPTQIAHTIDRKQTINEARDWPDWRLQKNNQPIEHIKVED